MKKPIIDLVFDFGKTNIKFYFFQKKDGKILEKLKFNNSLRKNKKKYLEINIDRYKKLLKKCISYGLKKYNINSLIPITHGSVMVTINDKDQVLNCISDENQYPKLFNKFFKKTVTLSKNTFTPLLPRGHNMFKSIYFIKKKINSDFRKIKNILLFPQYLSFYLSGKMSLELSYLANHSYLWDFKRRKFSSFYEQLGLRNFFPPIVNPFKKIGYLKKKFTENNHQKDILVYPGCHDSSGCYYFHKKFNEKKFILISTGTWIISYNSDGKINKFNIPTARYPGGIEFKLLNKKNKILKKIDKKILNKILLNKDYILPSFFYGGPYMNTKGKIVVKNPENIKSKKYMQHLIMLYVSLMSFVSLRQLGKIKNSIIIDGIFSNNIFFKSFISNLITDQKVYISADTEGVARGAFYIINHKMEINNYKYTIVKKDTSLIKILKNYKKFWEKKLI